MSRTKAKQVEKYSSAFVGLTGFAAAGGASDTLTTGLHVLR